MASISSERGVSRSMSSDLQTISSPSTIEQKEQQQLPSDLFNGAHDGVTLLKLDVKEQFEPSAATIPAPSNSTELLEDLIRKSKKKIRKRMWITLLVATILIFSSIACFNWETKYNVPLILGIFMIVIGLFSMVFLFICCCTYPSTGKHYLRMMNNVEHTIQLTGETWQNQIDSARSVPGKFIGYCNGKHYQSLRKRLYGHIVLAQKGIAVDELLAIDYGALLVLGIEPFIDTTGSFILRMHLITRIYAVGGFHKGKPTQFQLDLFMPPNLQASEVAIIGREILFNSHNCPVNFFYV